MSHFKDPADTPDIRRTLSVPVEPKSDPGEPRPSVLTCLESATEFEKVRAGVYAEYAPTNVLRELLADQLAETIWYQARLGLVAHQSLSFEMESGYQALLNRYPNADSAMHTIEAYRKIQDDPAIRGASAEQHKVTNRMLALLRRLDACSRRR